MNEILLRSAQQEEKEGAYQAIGLFHIIVSSQLVPFSIIGDGTNRVSAH